MNIYDEINLQGIFRNSLYLATPHTTFFFFFFFLIFFLHIDLSEVFLLRHCFLHTTLRIEDGLTTTGKTYFL